MKVLSNSILILFFISIMGCSNENTTSNNDPSKGTFEGKVIELNDDSNAQRKVLVQITNDITDYYENTEKIWLESNKNKVNLNELMVDTKIKVWTTGEISVSDPPIIMPTKIKILEK